MKKIFLIVSIALVSIIGGNTVSAANTLTVKKHSTEPVIETSRPTVGNTEIEKLMDTYIASEVAQFKIDADAMQKDFPDLNFTPSIYIDSEIMNNDTKIISVKLNQYTYFGGAHGNPSTKTFVYFPTKKKLLTLNNTKLLAKINKIVIPYFIKKQGESADKKWITDGLKPVVENWTNFTLRINEKGKLEITFYFEPYQIASYADGEQSITLNGKLKIVEPKIIVPEIIPAEDY